MIPERSDFQAPEIDAEGWLNCAPLRMEDLRGRVVLVDFWDYTCVNCIRNLPHIARWAKSYGRVGLSVVSIHTPEFPFAAERNNVETAARSLGIQFPVALDGARRTWKAWENRYLPARYLVDGQGRIRYFHFGDGSYEETENQIRSLLMELDPGLNLSPMALVGDLDARFGAVCENLTPELYLNLQIGRFGNEPLERAGDGVERFAETDRLDQDRIYLSGRWRRTRHYSEFAGGTAAGTLSVRFTAAEVNLVLMPPPFGAVSLSLRSGNGPLAVDQCGVDAIPGASGDVHVRVDTPRMYSLVQAAGVREEVLQVVVPRSARGLRAYAFTFMSCAWPPLGSGMRHGVDSAA